MQISKTLVLASKSPRRVALLNQIGIDPMVIPTFVPENLDASLSAVDNAIELSHAKAKAVAQQCGEAIIIGADTIVVLGNLLLGKPKDEPDAIRMLEILSGRSHTVITGFTLLDNVSGKFVSDFESTIVSFRDLPLEEIKSYVASGSPMDKAGAYGIQDDYGAVFVRRIEGCFYNVVGFPLSKFYVTLEKFQASLKEKQVYVEND